MSLFTRFDKKAPATQSYRIADGREERVFKLISSSEDTMDTAVLTEIMTGTSQSVNSLSTRLKANSERIARFLSRLSKAGLIAPVK